jgi:acetyl esterase/lipase
MKLVYKRAPLPEAQIVRDASYGTSGSPKQRLDLFMPAAAGWPTVIFIHGGNWDEGDRALKVGGADIYGNIGRFLAQHGYGAVVISYRLIPDVTWHTQADDVVLALKWVYDNVHKYGGDREAAVLMGHSAGAQLAVRTGLDAARVRRAGLPPGMIRGIIAVSGAGYDLTDEQTYALGNNPRFYEQRFRRSADDTDWQRAASVLPLVTAEAPPTLVIYAGGETKALIRQSRLLDQALRQAGVPTTVVESPGLSHTRIVPTLSRSDRPAGAAILGFLDRTFGR